MMGEEEEEEEEDAREEEVGVRRRFSLSFFHCFCPFLSCEHRQQQQEEGEKDGVEGGWSVKGSPSRQNC